MNPPTAPNKLKRASGDADGTFESEPDPRRAQKPSLTTDTIYTGNIMTTPPRNHHRQDAATAARQQPQQPTHSRGDPSSTLKVPDAMNSYDTSAIRRQGMFSSPPSK
ncbi:hypothetical protein H2200_010199 [Cladophialophora chaetospira]|uniref:Uncharacterized protein n=1 Tax=Cladophialophora chaetospira TaxID=386627 RepID=A0AA39CEU0_9EURO|nr:hypothetical protein H2200_010199 [Cladophialophora chaetospira]